MAVISPKKYNLSIGELTIESPKTEDAKELISFIKKVESETDFLMREQGEFNKSIEDEIKFIEDKIGNDKEIFLTAKINNKIIGTLGFYIIPYSRFKHRGQFGISISKDYWAYGIGSRLIDTMLKWADNAGFAKVTLEVDSNNLRAIRLYKSFGFEQEAMFKYDKYMGNGVYIDCIGMAKIFTHNLIV